MNTAEYLLENAHLDAVAVIDQDGPHSYGELGRAVSVIAGSLASLDLAARGSVGIVGPNSFFWVAAYLAVMKRGLVAVPFSTTLGPAEVARNAQIAHCTAAVMDRRSAQRLAASFGGAARILTEEVLGCEPLAVETVGVSPSSDATLMFTSGTTAEPKAVRLTHRNIQANTDSIVSFLELGPSDRMLVVLPFSYVFGASLLHTHLRVGGSLAICNTFAFPETAITMLDELGCTGIAGVPSTYQMLLRRSTFRSRPLPSLRLIQQAGGKLPPALIEELVSSQPGARVFVMYGASEATARLSYLPPEDLPAKLGSVGRGIPGVELMVLDSSGFPVGPGGTGEIFARGDNISPGYLDDPVTTADKFPNGMLRTGDLATVDDDGYIYVLDRKDDFIKSWGHRVSSQEVEAGALTHTGLVSAAAVGVPDRDAGEAICLFVTVNPDANLTEQEVLAHCRRALPKHLLPRQVRIVKQLPLNSAGKVVKAVLRDLAAHASTFGEEAGHGS